MTLTLLLAAFGGGGGGGSSLPSTPTTPAPPTTASDDWTTYAHDEQRTGYETQVTGLTSATVPSLQLAWRATPDANCATQATANPATATFADEASPLVANGFVYYADVCGYVAALSRDTGDVVWHTQLPVPALGGVFGTPTLDLANNLLIVPVRGTNGSGCGVGIYPCANPAQGGYLVALNAQTGAIFWKQTPLFAGNLRGEPIAVNGIVYEGLAGGDPDAGYTNGGLFALNEENAEPIGTLPFVQAAPVGESYDGGGSWTPISYDGRNLYFGFGNTRDDLGLEDSVVQYDTATQQVAPNFPLQTFTGSGINDDDVGGGEMLWGGDLYFEGKNGNFYAYPLADPSVPLADVPVNTNTAPGDGAIWTPTTDGNVVAVSSGYNTGYNGTNEQVSSKLHLFSVGSSADRCQINATNSTLYSYAAFVNGVGFTGLDNQVPNGTPDGSAGGPAPEFIAFDDQCNILWKDNLHVLAFFYGGPAVVPSGAYAVDDVGNVYAWKLPSAISTTAKKRRASLIRPGVRSTVRTSLYMRRSARP